MARRLWMNCSFWRRWILRITLLSFVGLYGLVLLPHHHPLNEVNDHDCVVCHAVSGLGQLTGNASPATPHHADYVLKVVLVLPWVPATIARSDRRLLLRHSRAPPAVS